MLHLFILIFMSRFEMILLHHYESAEALCCRRSRVSTAAEWQAVWADSRWYGSAVMSNGQVCHFKGIIMYIEVMILLSLYVHWSATPPTLYS